MSTMIKISPLLQQLISIPEIVGVSGTSVRACLNDIILKYPQIDSFMFDKYGILKAIVVINRKALPRNDLDTAISGNDVISIFIPMAGG